MSSASRLFSVALAFFAVNSYATTNFTRPESFPQPSFRLKGKGLQCTDFEGTWKVNSGQCPPVVVVVYQPDCGHVEFTIPTQQVDNPYIIGGMTSETKTDQGRIYQASTISNWNSEKSVLTVNLTEMYQSNGTVPGSHVGTDRTLMKYRIENGKLLIDTAWSGIGGKGQGACILDKQQAE